MNSKTELVRSIQRQPDGTVKINLTVKVGESFILADTITIVDQKDIQADAIVHTIELVYGEL